MINITGKFDALLLELQGGYNKFFLGGVVNETAKTQFLITSGEIVFYFQHSPLSQRKFYCLFFTSFWSSENFSEVHEQNKNSIKICAE